MKNNRLALLILPLLFSCKTNQLFLNVIEPAPVTVPSYVKSVGVINRSMPTEETKVFDAIEKVFTLESVDLDKDGASEAIKGLSDELMNNNRFTEVKTLNDIDFRTSRLENFPTPLSWEIVNQICNETGTDALFSLEKFDTDTHIGYAANKVEISTPLGPIPGIEHQADMQTLVKTGWRIYDPGSKSIIDEYIYEESIQNSGRGINPLVAVQALSGRKEAVREVSNKAGHGYAFRIIPYKIRVTRDYFVKGTNNFKIAKRKAQMGLWDEAGDLWKKETGNSSPKIAGRAAYNMGIISEINGDVDAALGWAQKAWGDYNIKLALDYVKILQNRKYKNDVLKEQRGN
jgi:Family of unknown function (DUF6340)